MKIKSIFHAFTAYLIYRLSVDFSLTILPYHLKSPWRETVYVFLQIATIWILAFLYTKYIRKASWTESYLGRPFPEKKWILTAVLVPTALCLFYVLFTSGKLQREAISGEQLMHAVSFSLLSSGLRAGIVEEMTFRGLMLAPLSQAFGKKVAVFVSGLFFTLLHLGSTEFSGLEELLLFIFALFAASTAFSLVTYQTGSVWSSAVIHGMFNLLSGDTYIFHIDVEQNFPAVWTYTLNSRNPLLAGIPGSGTIDYGLPAIIAFLTIISLALLFMRQQSKTPGIKGIN